MIPEIKYEAPEVLKDVLSLLNGYNGKARIIAGGTDIIPGFHIESNRFKNIKLLIDIRKIKKLHNISISGGNILIGAATTFSNIERDPIINEYLPLLVTSASGIGSRQIRNVASIGGNIINNAPCADSVPPLLVYNARLVLESLEGKRTIPLEEFLISAYKTAIRENELVTGIITPIPDKEINGEFYKLGRRRGVAISRISLAFLIKNVDGILKELRVASGAVTPIGKRFYEIEGKYLNNEFKKNDCKHLAAEIAEYVLELTGFRWSSPYKLPVLQQLIYALLIKYI